MSTASLLSWWSWHRVGFAAALAISALGGCAAPPADPVARAAYDEANDPLEPLNRKTFAFNQAVDKVVFKPTAQAYVAVLPGDVRSAVHHMLDNMKEPTLFFNNVLQGQFKRAAITFGRFAVNTTVGFGGIIDVMTLSGVERQPADFGQTLYVWGVPSGPYLILPILGPTNPRDAVGSAVDSYDDPFTILANEHGITELTTARFIVGGVEERASVLDELDTLEKNAVDFYAEMRSLAQQHRAAELKNGKAPDAEPDLYMDPGKAAPAKPDAARATTLRVAAPTVRPTVDAATDLYPDLYLDPGKAVPPEPGAAKPTTTRIAAATPAVWPAFQVAAPPSVRLEVQVAPPAVRPTVRVAVKVKRPAPRPVHTVRLKRWGSAVSRCAAPRCVAPRA